MVECTSVGITLPEAYHNALCKLNLLGRIANCPDYNTVQKEISMTMTVLCPLADPMISRMIPCGTRELEQYCMEMLDGILDFEVEKGNWVYTYHQRMVDQFDFIIKELTRNPDSRRAVIVVRDKEKDMESSDPACLQHIQYFIRGGELHCKVLFRSNDAVKATFMNAFALIMLQKRFADQLGVEVGTYTHRANSFHAYERDFGLLDSYVKRIRKSNINDITFDYKDNWEIMMEEDRKRILADVEVLKGR